MQILDELEPTRRGVYAGAVGYFGFWGNLDTCIAIRTLVFKGDRVYLQAGAGIVADSDPATEYQETVAKLEALKRALEMAEGDMLRPASEARSEPEATVDPQAKRAASRRRA
jgi:anthranilate synthase component 1